MFLTAFQKSQNSGSEGVKECTKNFDIVSPDKPGYRLRHRCLESPEARLVYEFQVDCNIVGKNTIALPSYFRTIAYQNVICYVSPYKTFGSGWAETLDGVNLDVYTTMVGTFNVMVVGTRMDQLAINEFNTYGVEYPDPHLVPAAGA